MTTSVSKNRSGGVSKSRRAFRMFITFFRIGACTIGGGYAMIPLIEREFVQKQKWVSEEEIVDIFAIVQSVPVVIAINSSIFVGYKIAGIWGALAACFGMVLPSFLIISIIAMFYVSFQDMKVVQHAFAGVRAGVTALIGMAAFRLGKKVIHSPLSFILAVSAFLGMLLFDVPAVAIVVAAALLGVFRYRLFPQLFEPSKTKALRKDTKKEEV